MGRLSGSLESHKIQENENYSKTIENYSGAMRFKTLTQILDRKWSDKFEYVVNIVYG